MGDHVNKLAVYACMHAVLDIIVTVGELGLKSFLNNTGYGCVAGYSGGCIH